MNMKNVVLVMTVLLMCAVLSARELRIVTSGSDKSLSLKTLAKDLNGYDLIVFGEYHDNTSLHDLQKDLLPLLNTKRELILSFEMFERDVQCDLDAYIEGWISEEQFLLKSHPWPNYESDYRPLIEYARKHKLSAIAANVPRRYAGQLSRQGMTFLDELEPEERRWMADKLTAPRDDYQKAFYAMMSMASSVLHGAMTDDKNMEQLYQAQCLKDDTMAESIVRAFTAKPKARIIHFNGDFHSRNFMGTVSRVKNALPKLKIAVISPVYNDSWQNNSLTPEDKTAGTHLILMPYPIQGGEE